VVNSEYFGFSPLVLRSALALVPGSGLGPHYPEAPASAHPRRRGFTREHKPESQARGSAEGIADHAWSAEELIERTADYNPVRPLPPPKTLGEWKDRLLPDDEE